MRSDKHIPKHTWSGELKSAFIIYMKCPRCGSLLRTKYVQREELQKNDDRLTIFPKPCKRCYVVD